MVVSTGKKGTLGNENFEVQKKGTESPKQEKKHSTQNGKGNVKGRGGKKKTM